jgi:hypothetical protein
MKPWEEYLGDTMWGTTMLDVVFALKRLPNYFVLDRLPNYGYSYRASQKIEFGPLLELIEESQKYFDEVCDNAKKHIRESTKQEKAQKLAELENAFADLRDKSSDEAKKQDELAAKGITPETKSNLEKEIGILNGQIESFDGLLEEIRELLKR